MTDPASGSAPELRARLTEDASPDMRTLVADLIYWLRLVEKEPQNEDAWNAVFDPDGALRELEALLQVSEPPRCKQCFGQGIVAKYPHAKVDPDWIPCPDCKPPVENGEPLGS